MRRHHSFEWYNAARFTIQLLANNIPGGKMKDPITWKAREIEILALLAKGLTNSQIGSQLHLSHDTIRWYNKQIFEKLAVSNRLQAVKRAAELGLLEQPAFGSPQPSSPVIKSPVQYVANGDVHLAYQMVGNGPVDLLFIHGFLFHLELAWENAEFSHFFSELGRFTRVILFDKRGVGLSDRIQGAPTLENTIDDACCVLDAAQSERAFVMGTSEGAAAAVLLSAIFPERVRGLILYAAVPKVVRTGTEPPWASDADQYRANIVRMQQSWGGPWAVESFAPSRAQDDQFRSWWAMILRAASSPSSVKAVLELIGEVDIRSLLPQVQVRTLVIHKREDRIASLEAGRYFATHMPNATWVELPGNDHIYFVESTAVLDAIVRFCREEAGMTTTFTKIAIILRLLIKKENAKLSESFFEESQPLTVQNTSGGMFAVFESPTRALQCALRLRGNINSLSYSIGLHIGECSLANNHPTEPAFMAAGIAAGQSAPGEIVVTQSLRDILAGSGFQFRLKKGPSAADWPLYSVV